MKLVWACLPLHSLLWWETRLKRRFSRYCIVEGFSTVGVALSHYFTLFKVFFKDPFPNLPYRHLITNANAI